MQAVPAPSTVIAVSFPAPPEEAHVTTTFASDAARQAAAQPGVSAALAVGASAADAILRHDVSGFAAVEASELIIHSPANRVLSGAQSLEAFKAGLIDYSAIKRVIEFATMRPNGEVMWMGAEHVEPRSRTRYAGKAVTYRVTEIYSPQGGAWKLSMRHATIAEVT